jgi:transglutaminase-like putative cysteine protease
MRKGCSWLLALLFCLAPVALAQEEANYYAIMVDGKKAGYAIQRRGVADSKVTSTEEFHVSINRMGLPITLDVIQTSVETADGKPLGFEASQSLSLVTTVIKGQVRPNGTMEVVTRSMGSELKTEPNWPAGAVMSEGLRLLSLQKGLAEGTKYDAKVWVGVMMQAIDVHIAVGPRREVDILGTSVPLTEVKSTESDPGVGQVVTTSYVDDQQVPYRTQTSVAGIPMEMVRCTREFAMGRWDPVELISDMLLPSPVALGDVSKAASITYLLRPKDAGAGLTLPSSDTQTVRRAADGAIEVTVRPIRPREGGPFPYKGDDPNLLAALKPSTYLQVQDPSIVQLARQAVDDVNDAAEAVRRIEAFVAGYIKEKDLSVGYASAAEVAKTKQGDCTEHAVLAAALCRAAGIPAKVVTGLAYVQEFAGVKNCFGGHAWTAAYVGGHWIALDAAFRGTGRGGYDAGHIALAMGDGGAGDFFAIATRLGQFTIEKITVNAQ